MTWLAWRQLRLQVLGTLAALAALTVLLIITGLHLRDVAHSIGGADCRASFSCNRLTGSESTFADVLGPLLLVIPALVGMFWGAPLVAREIETGTYRLAWTQSVTRQQWLKTKIVVFGAASIGISALATLLITWWFDPLDTARADRLHPSVFTERGLVVVGYAAFAFALGVAASALIRRVLPAMMATLIGFTAVRLLVTLARPHLLPSSHTTLPGDGPLYSFAIPNTWTLSDKKVGTHLRIGAQQFVMMVQRGCRITGTRVCRPILNKKGEVPHKGRIPLHHITYISAGKYWPLQLIETAIFLLLAAALIWFVIRRAAPRRRSSAPAPGEHVTRLLPMPKPAPDLPGSTSEAEPTEPRPITDLTVRRLMTRRPGLT